MRGNNDEELGKEVLDTDAIFQRTPYGHENIGTISSLEKMTLEDVKRFYRTHYSQANLILGIAGGYTTRFDGRLQSDFARLPEMGTPAPPSSHPEEIAHNRALIVDKNTRSVAYSIGFPIDVTRPDRSLPGVAGGAGLLRAASRFHRSAVSSGCAKCAA